MLRYKVLISSIDDSRPLRQLHAPRFFFFHWPTCTFECTYTNTLRHGRSSLPCPTSPPYRWSRNFQMPTKVPSRCCSDSFRLTQWTGPQQLRLCVIPTSQACLAPPRCACVCVSSCACMRSCVLVSMHASLSLLLVVHSWDVCLIWLPSA